MKPSRRILSALAAAFALAGLAGGLRPAATGLHGLIDILLAVTLMASIYAWCRAEALERGRVAPGRSALWAALLSLVFLPVYFLRTRRFGAACLACAKALGVYVLLSLLQLGCDFAASSWLQP